MKNVILKKINALLVTTSLVTMVFSPVAMGKQAQVEAEKLTKTQIEQFIQETGLNKSMTVGEFYKKNKASFSDRVQKLIEPMMMANANEPMPQFEVTENQNSKGEKIATLRISGKNQLSNIQFLGEEKKFVKFDNTNLTLDDVADFNSMISRLYHEDASHRKGMIEAPTTTRTLKKTSAKNSTTKESFKGLPKITPTLWKKMTPEQRAQFVLNMQYLYASARRVLDASESATPTQKNKKTSSLEKWNNFFAMLNKAEAVSAGTECVVAGYISTYKTSGGKTKCVYPDGMSTSSCKNPCNPTVYGYDSSGSRFCIDDSQLQTATHFKQGCDLKLPLGDVELAPANKSLFNSKRYEGLAEKNKTLALEKNKAAAVKGTKQFLESIFKNKGTSTDPQKKALAEAYKTGKLTAELLEEFKKIQSEYDAQIAEARSKCAKAADQKQADPQFWGACDQLHARFLFVAEYLKEPPLGCGQDSSFDEGSFKCLCSNGTPAVLPGEKCNSAPAPQPAGECAPACKGNETCDKTKSPPKCEPSPSPGPDTGKCDPACVAPEKCEKVASDGASEVWECKKSGGGDKPDDNNSGGGIWGFIKKAAPWVLGAAGLYLFWNKFLKPKKPALKPAADVCPNGAVPPCGTICTVQGQVVLASGACGCPACPPGQVQSATSPCSCSAGTTTTTTMYLCADGVTQVADLASCPSTASYTCWDGSTVANPINCPEQTTTPVTTKPGTIETGR